MFEVYRQSAFVVVLLEQSDFGNSPEFTLNKAAILNLKCWTQGIWTAQEHLVNTNVVFNDKNRLWHHFIIGEHKNIEDGMQQILRLACEKGELSWLHVVGK
ncbi:hypothetical protein C2G38_2156223 [Gigaspora rosea]|uniref:Uncharacterized protein n=1 Tax=Gigaspora rosea TaxID=44941 RepID=A0A397W4U4_9GLOM|nr:hypothetical protein C2G38_2156223 [Gigaspora rosea]